jgi:hypothetical protein
MKLLVIILIAAASCTKATVAGEAIKPKTDQKEPPPSQAQNLDKMLAFIRENALLKRHATDSTATWWESEKILLDGREIKTNKCFFPTFWQQSQNCQVSRQINFYRDTTCYNTNKYTFFTANVTVYVGSKQFEWRDADMQWSQNLDLIRHCPSENWAPYTNPKNIVIILKPKGAI